MKYRDKIILVDCDGVLMDWRYKFTRWMETIKGHRMMNDNMDYDVSIQFDLSRREINPLIQEFNRTDSQIAHVPPHRDAIKYVKKLHEEHGYVFHMITAMHDLVQGDNVRYHDSARLDELERELARNARIRNTRDLFGETAFEEYHFTEGGDKTEHLKRYENTECYWIEDKISNAILGEALGLEPILMRHKYNENVNKALPGQKEIKVCSNWEDVYYHIV